MKSILFTGLLFCLASSPLHVTGQEHNQADKAASQDADKGKADSINNPIEVKTDRFSNVTTVTLKPQTILDKPDHVITMEIETKLEEKAPDDKFKEVITARVSFESRSKKPVDTGDEKIHFLINGEPLTAPPGRFRPVSSIPDSGFITLPILGASSFNRRDLELLSKADRVEIRLGSIELTLSKAMVSTLREYAIQTLTQHKNKISKERKQ